MTWGEWVLGWLVLAVQVGAAAAAGNGLRRRLAPLTTGTPAAPVATAVCALAVVVVTSLALGSVGLFTAWAVPPVLVVTAVVLDPRRGLWRPAAPAGNHGGDGGADHDLDHDAEPAADHDAGSHRNEGAATRWAAWAAMVMLGAAWVDRVVAVYRRGLTDGDSFMYHLPFAARFVQRGWTTGTDPIGPDAWVAFYPANVELLHAWTILPFGRDVVVPLTNLAWLALAIVAARAIGAVTGRASVATTVVGVVLCLPILVATQGGTARVDVATIALVLAAIALLGACPRTPGSVAIAGAALGLAIGSKFALLPLAGTMLVVVAVTLWRRHSWRMAGVWAGGATLTAGYWYARNWWVTGSPVPAIDLRIGPVGFAPLPADRIAPLEDSSLVAESGNPGFWGNLVRGLADQFTGSQYIGIGIVAVALVAVALLVRQRPWGVRHAVAVAGLVGCVAYPLAPYSAPIAGAETSNPIALLIVILNVRYLLPSLVVLLCLLPIGLAGLSRRIGDAVAVAAAAMTVLLWRRSLAFDAEWPTSTGDAQTAAAAVVAVGVAFGLWALSRRSAGAGPWAAGLVAVTSVAVVAGAVTSAPLVADDGTRLRYADFQPELVALWRAADGLEGQRLALIGGWLQYPFMGETLGTEVDYVGVPGDKGLSAPPQDCDEVADALAAEDYDVVVALQQAYGDNGEVGLLADCLRRREGATVVADTGSGLVVAFEPG
jgi:hypothetical protein